MQLAGQAGCGSQTGHHHKHIKPILHESVSGAKNKLVLVSIHVYMGISMKQCDSNIFYHPKVF